MLIVLWVGLSAHLAADEWITPEIREVFRGGSAKTAVFEQRPEIYCIEHSLSADGSLVRGRRQRVASVLARTGNVLGPPGELKTRQTLRTAHCI